MKGMSLKIVPTGHIALAVFRPDFELLSRQLASIAAQSLADWTCEIGIDGDDPGTRDQILGLIADDSRFTVSMFSERLGFYRNFERLLTRVPSAAEWVALSDQDDVWFENKLELLVPSLSAASLVVGEAYVVNRDHEGPGVERTARHVGALAPAMIDNQVTGSLAVLRASLLALALPFPQATDVAYHDHWLGICALASDGVASFPEPVQNYVQHDSNVIGEETGKRLGSRLAALNVNGVQSLGQKLDYLSEHRWGWRVNMATDLLARMSGISAENRTVLEMYSVNRLTARYLRSSSTQIIQRKVPLLRTLALVAGAARAPRARTAHAE